MNGKIKHRRLEGSAFGLWTVISYTKYINCRHYWLCRCACGAEHDVLEYNLISGHTERCNDCRKIEVRKHGHSNCPVGGVPVTPTYGSWLAMKKRCNNPSNPQYHWYGGRGIKICDRWKDFRQFLSDMGERPPGKTLERIDTNGNYEPSNCRWATSKEQNSNRRDNRLVRFGSERITITEAGRRIGLGSGHLHELLSDVGWPDIDTSVIPKLNPKRFLRETFGGQGQ